MIKRKIKQSHPLPAELKHVHLNAAGIDISAQSHFVAIPEGRDEKTVREFKSFTQDLYELADRLSYCGIETVVMESTGVYWVPLYEILESRGFEVKLVNARHVKNVPGRKSDVLDCQWLQQLHTYGLLEGSFHPAEAICVLRPYMRQRDTLIKCAASHIQHMQKAMMQMNLQLHHVVSQITGATGMRIIRAILGGERCAEKLALLRDERCKNSVEVIQKALTGNYREEHLFALRQALELYDVYQDKVASCDLEIEKVLKQFEEQSPPPSKRLGDMKRKKRQNNELHFDARTYLYEITGVDLTRIDGIEAFSTLKIIAEIGLDMNRWKGPKQFCSWLGLAPGTKISGGKRLSGKTKASANKAAAAFRIAANTLYHSVSALGAFLRRQKGRLGAPKAITATANKLARLFYTMLKDGKEYVDRGQDYYKQRYRERVIKNMTHKAKLFGLQLVQIKPISAELTAS